MKSNRQKCKQRKAKLTGSALSDFKLMYFNKIEQKWTIENFQKSQQKSSKKIKILTNTKYQKIK